MLKSIIATLYEKFLQYVISIAGGLIVAFESSINFFIPCLIAIVIDVYTAWALGRRVHKKYPEKADGKFKREYKYRIITTMIIIFLAIIVANYVDVYVIKDSDISVRFVVAFFLFYQAWSCVENWSSENDNKMALVLQRIMVNKAERHFNIKMSDILLNDKKENKNETK